MREYVCDFHIHSTLSPCAALEMSPRAIVAKSREIGLDMIAITDHNMVENCVYARRLTRDASPFVLFGMEIQTQEEVHLLALFDNHAAAAGLQDEIYALLPAVANDVSFFGDQVVVDEDDEIVRFEERLLLNSAQISLTDAVSRVKSLGGVAIASHIDSPTFSVISQLGYVPADVPFDALEAVSMEEARRLSDLLMDPDVPLVAFSDAHYLKDIGARRTTLTMAAPSCEEIEKALRRLRTAREGTPVI